MTVPAWRLDDVALATEARATDDALAAAVGSIHALPGMRVFEPAANSWRRPAHSIAGA